MVPVVQVSLEVRAIFEAFAQAKQIGLERLINNRDSGLFWYYEALEEQLQLMGEDPVPYSVDKNRSSMETLLRWCAEQGLVDRTLAVNELFYEGFD